MTRVNRRIMRLGYYVRLTVGCILSLIVFAVMGSILWVMKSVAGVSFLSVGLGSWDNLGGGK